MSPWSRSNGIASIAPPGPSIRQALPAASRRSVRHRRIRTAFGDLENIRKFLSDDERGRLVHVDVDAAPGHVKERPQIVDPVGVVGVRMGDQHAVEALTPASINCSRRSGEVSISTVVAPAGPRSTSAEQRRRRFRGLAGSQAPQPCATRGTPADEPQPRMVRRQAQGGASCRPSFGEDAAACWRASPPRAPRGRCPSLRRARARSRRRTPARCACRDAERARDRARRSRPGGGRAGRRGRWRASRRSS